MTIKQLMDVYFGDFTAVIDCQCDYETIKKTAANSDDVKKLCGDIKIDRITTDANGNLQIEATTNKIFFNPF